MCFFELSSLVEVDLKVRAHSAKYPSINCSLCPHLQAYGTCSPNTNYLCYQCSGFVKDCTISKKDIPKQDIIYCLVLQFGEPY
jgi:hypothetical protein